MRFFPDIKERSIVEVIHLLEEVHEEQGNVNIPLTHNLEVITNSIEGRINIHQLNFNIYGYTVVCSINDEKNKKDNQKTESYLFGGSTVGDELVQNLRNGGTSEDTASFQQYKKQDRDEFTSGEHEKDLVLTALLKFQKQLLYKGILLGRLLKSTADGEQFSALLLREVTEDYPELKEILVDALEVWDIRDLVECMGY